MTPRRAGIIATGLGSRLTAAGIVTPKPLIPVAGRPLIHWVVSQFLDSGFSSIAIIVNQANAAACDESLRRAFPAVAFDLIRKDTSSSFESFYEVLARAGDEPMLVTTADTLMAPGTLSAFVAALDALPDDALALGVSSHIDDEKPLYVAADEDGRITAIGVERSDRVTCGVYCLPAGLARGGHGGSHVALRAFLGAIVERGTPAFAVDCGETIDVDRPRDLAAAERLVAAHGATRPGGAR